MFDQGLPYRTPKCCETVELQGRGLFSKAVTAKCNRSPTLRSCRRQCQQQLLQQSKRKESPPPLSLPQVSVDAAAAACYVTGTLTNANECARRLSEAVQQAETTSSSSSSSSSSVPVKMATSVGVFAAMSNDETSLGRDQSLQRVAIQ